MSKKPIDKRQSYFFNPVTISFFAIFLAIGVTMWSVGPSLMVRIETNRVLKTTARKFTERRSILLSNEKAFDNLYSQMMRDLHGAGVQDPSMEGWIELDSQGQAEIGVIYSLQVHWPLDIRPPSTTEVRQTAHSSK